MYNSAILTIVNELPILKSILDKYISYIYGGFLRFIVSYIMDNDKAPTMDIVLDYIECNDIDIRIRSNRKFKTYSHYSILEYIKKQLSHNRHTINTTQNEYNLTYMSNYIICYHIKIPFNGRILKYDITITDLAAHKYDQDFTVNSLKYNNKLYSSEILEYVLTDIKAKKICFIYTTYKTIYRANRLYKLGYKADINTIYQPSNKWEDFTYHGQYITWKDFIESEFVQKYYTQIGTC